MKVLQQSLNCMEIQRLYYIDNITGSIHDTVHSDDVVAIFDFLAILHCIVVSHLTR